MKLSMMRYSNIAWLGGEGLLMGSCDDYHTMVTCDSNWTKISKNREKIS